MSYILLFQYTPFPNLAWKTEYKEINIRYNIEKGCRTIASRILFLNLIASVILIINMMLICIIIKLIIILGQAKTKTPSGNKIKGNKNNTEISSVAAA